MRTGPRLLMGVVTAALLAGPVAELAASTSTANLAVSATVIRNCTITTSLVAFGSYDPVVANATTPLDAAGSVTVACTKGTPATIGLNLGANASGSTRRMAAGEAAYLDYELYKDGTRSAIWGNSASDLYDIGVAPSKDPRVFSIYGRVIAGQDATVGAYTDTVVAAVNF